VIDQKRKKTMASLDELFEGGSEDDRPMSFEITDGEPTPLTALPTSRTGSGLRRDCSS